MVEVLQLEMAQQVVNPSLPPLDAGRATGGRDVTNRQPRFVVIAFSPTSTLANPALSFGSRHRVPASTHEKLPRIVLESILLHLLLCTDYITPYTFYYLSSTDVQEK